MENAPRLPQKIRIPAFYKKQLCNEFQTSSQTVHCALNYFNNSPLAKSIRVRAGELLRAEADKILIPNS